MSDRRLLPLLLFIASAAVLAAVWASQIWGHLVPCELCLYERWPYYAVLVLSAAALISGRSGVAKAALALAALIFLAGAALAFYHVGVERHWFAGPTACTGSGAADSLEEFRRRLLAQQPVACDQAQWSLFGVTLAGWNVVASLVLALFSIWALRRLYWRRG
ncbi:MAG TPA: disulfide bond formation protein B [Stellaceae bacterium]|nr:disulfide bond formation protein B [Stellaceae bacterium]